jgi:hypothetical protein
MGEPIEQPHMIGFAFIDVRGDVFDADGGVDLFGLEAVWVEVAV